MGQVRVFGFSKARSVGGKRDVPVLVFQVRHLVSEEDEIGLDRVGLGTAEKQDAELEAAVHVREDAQPVLKVIQGDKRFRLH